MTRAKVSTAFRATAISTPSTASISTVLTAQTATVVMANRSIQRWNAPYDRTWIRSFELGVRTERDAATFYLGGRGIARGHAEQFASSSGATTLESTAGGRWLDELWRFDWKDRPRLTTEEADTVWRETSRLYAEQASGNVRAFVSNPKTTSVFVTVELPALKQGMAEGRIYSITIVDVATGKTTVLRPDERGPHGR